MKNNSRKIGIATILLCAYQAMAFWIVALIIIVIVVAGIIVYELYHCARQHLYGNQANISRVWTNDPNSFTTFQLPYHSPGDLAFAGQSAWAYTPEGFTISYGLDTNSLWVAVGEIDPFLVEEPSDISPNTDGSVNFSQVVTMSGAIVRLNFDGVTGFWSSQVIAEDTNVYSLVIERTMDFQNWVPVFTNLECSRWDAQTWTDPDMLESAFYRAVTY